MHGSKLLWKLIESTRYLRKLNRIKLDEVLQRNNYFAHPDNFFIEMVFDEKDIIRKLAIDRIKMAKLIESHNIRRFCVLKINLNGSGYIDFIN